MTVNEQDYAVIRLLGKGKGGYSYLVSDGTKQYVLKQLHHEPCAYYTFGDKLAAEMHDYTVLRQAGIRIPKMLGVDRAAERILKEYIDGPTVYQQLLQGELPAACLSEVHRMSNLARAAGLNIDYFPTNFILQNGQLYYIDYECNPYEEKWDFAHWGSLYWARTEVFEAYVREHS